METTTQQQVVAVIEITVPLDEVTPESSKWEKQDAAGKVAGDIHDALPYEIAQWGNVARWEDREAF